MAVAEGHFIYRVDIEERFKVAVVASDVQSVAPSDFCDVVRIDGMAPLNLIARGKVNI